MKRIIFLMFFCFYFSNAQNMNVNDSLFTETQKIVEDGKWWIELGAFDKLPFIAGVFDGLSLGATFVLNSYDQNEMCYKISSSCIDEFFSRLDTIRIGHIYEQLEEFYSDTLNLSIPFSDSFKYVVYKMSGYTPEQLEELLVLYRRKYQK